MEQDFFLNQFNKEMKFLEDCQIEGVRTMPYILSDLHCESDPEIAVIINDQFELIFNKETQSSELRTNNSHQPLATEAIKNLIFVDQFKAGVTYYLKKLSFEEEVQ